MSYGQSDPRPGFAHKLYRNTGTTSVPVWTEVVNVGDVTFNGTKALADVTTRATGGYRAQLPTLKERGFTTTMIYIPDDDDYDAFAESFEDNTVLDLAFADGDITEVGTRFFRAPFGINEFTQNEQLAEGVNFDVSGTIALSPGVPIGYFVVATPTPTPTPTP